MLTALGNKELFCAQDSQLIHRNPFELEQRKCKKYIFSNDGVVNEAACDCGSVMDVGSTPIDPLLPWVFLHTKRKRQAQRRRGNGTAWALLCTGWWRSPTEFLSSSSFHRRLLLDKQLETADWQHGRPQGHVCDLANIWIGQKECVFFRKFHMDVSDGWLFAIDQCRAAAKAAVASVFVVSGITQLRVLQKPHDETQEDNDNPWAYSGVRAHFSPGFSCKHHNAASSSSALLSGMGGSLSVRGATRNNSLMWVSGEPYLFY